MAGPRVTETSDHVRKNREHWEGGSAAYQERNASQLDRWDRLGWGTWDLAEEDLQALGDVRGLDVLEYGCGACQSGIRVAMRGARVTGLDFSMAQLRHGRTKMAETAVRFPVVQADGTVTGCAVDVDAALDLGNVMDGQTLDQIWHSARYRKLWALHAWQRWDELPEPCRSCDSWDFTATARSQHLKETIR